MAAMLVSGRLYSPVAVFTQTLRTRPSDLPVQLEYSADSPFAPDSVTIGHGYDIIYSHIALFYVPLSSVLVREIHLSSYASRRSRIFSVQTLDLVVHSLCH